MVMPTGTGPAPRFSLSVSWRTAGIRTASILATAAGIIGDVVIPMRQYINILLLVIGSLAAVAGVLWFGMDRPKLKSATRNSEITTHEYAMLARSNLWNTGFLILTLAFSTLFAFYVVDNAFGLRTEATGVNRGVLARLPAVADLQERLLKLDRTATRIDEKTDRIEAIASDTHTMVAEIHEKVQDNVNIANLTTAAEMSAIVDLNQAVATGKPSRRVAVLYFDNTGGQKELDAFSKGLAGMLISDLSNIRSLQILPRDDLEKILKEQKLQSGTAFDPGTSVNVGKLWGAEFIITGTYFEVFGSLRIDARVIDVETGEIRSAEGVTGNPKNWGKLEKQLVYLLAKSLGVRVLEATEMPGEMNFDAVKQYSVALEEYDKGNSTQARSIIDQLLRQAPDFAPANQLLANLQNEPSTQD
jgi:TolB-like protein